MEERLNLKIRSCGKDNRYYQAGYYNKGKWYNIEHLGTAEKIIELIRRSKEKKQNTHQQQERIKKIDVLKPKFSQHYYDTYQNYEENKKRPIYE